MFEHRSGDHRIEHHRHMRRLTLRAPSRRSVRRAASFPLVPPNRASPGCAPPNTSNRAACRRSRPARWAQPKPNNTTAGIRRQSMRIRQHFSARGRVERSALRVFNARIGVHRRLFGAPRILDSLGSGKGINVFVIKMEVARKRSELAARGFPRTDPRTDLRQFQRRLQHALDSGSGKIARIRAGRALPEETRTPMAVSPIPSAFRPGPVAPPSKIHRLRGRRTPPPSHRLSSRGGLRLGPRG